MTANPSHRSVQEPFTGTFPKPLEPFWAPLTLEYGRCLPGPLQRPRFGSPPNVTLTKRAPLVTGMDSKVSHHPFFPHPPVCHPVPRFRGGPVLSQTIGFLSLCIGFILSVWGLEKLPNRHSPPNRLEGIKTARPVQKHRGGSIFSKSAGDTSTAISSDSLPFDAVSAFETVPDLCPHPVNIDPKRLETLTGIMRRNYVFAFTYHQGEAGDIRTTLFCLSEKLTYGPILVRKYRRNSTNSRTLRNPTEREFLSKYIERWRK